MSASRRVRLRLRLSATSSIRKSGLPTKSGQARYKQVIHQEGHGGDTDVRWNNLEAGCSTASSAERRATSAASTLAKASRNECVAWSRRPRRSKMRAPSFASSRFTLRETVVASTLRREAAAATVPSCATRNAHCQFSHSITCIFACTRPKVTTLSCGIAAYS